MRQHDTFDVPPILLPFASAINRFGGGRSSGRYARRYCPRCGKLKLTFWRRDETCPVLFGCWRAGCTATAADKAEVLKSAGLTFRDLWPGRDEPRRRMGRIVKTYPYRDAQGQLLYETVRYEPKEFKQRQPGPTPGSWVWSMDDVTRVLYRLPELLAAEPSRGVLLVEGEKDVETAERLGLLATTNVGGSRQKWLDSYSETLSGRHVAIIPDNDEPGRLHAQEAWGSLCLHDVASVRLVSLPQGKDLTEFLEGLTRQGITESAWQRREVERLLGSVIPWGPVGLSGARWVA